LSPNGTASDAAESAEQSVHEARSFDCEVYWMTVAAAENCDDRQQSLGPLLELTTASVGQDGPEG
jgi:hypothetical protein